MTLKDLAIGESALISKTGGNGELRQHFLDMGVIPGTEITKIKLAPMGDPAEFDINGYELTMRLADAEKIEVEKEDTMISMHSNSEHSITGTTANTGKSAHPGLGEDGKFHAKGDGDPLPAFRGEPRVLEAEDFYAWKLWDCLDKENRISLYVREGDESTLINARR